MNKYLTVDIGGSKLLTGIADAKGHILEMRRKDYAGPYTKEQLISDIKKLVAMMPSYGITAGGVTVPGLADPVRGIWLNSPYTGISSWNITDELSEIFGFPFYSENDVNACAAAERKFGICKNENSYMWITLSNGVGGALYIDGKLYSGRHFAAGEIGHIIVEENGVKCCCGNYGCLETAASGRGVTAYYYSLTGNTLDAKKISELASAGDKAAVRTFERLGTCLGKAISAAANILNISLFVLGGGVSQSFELFGKYTEEELKKSVFKSANPEVSLKYTGLGYNAALIGGAALAMEGEKRNELIRRY